MANEKLTALESSAIKRKRSQLSQQLQKAMQPIIAVHLGSDSSADIARNAASMFRM